RARFRDLRYHHALDARRHLQLLAQLRREGGELQSERTYSLWGRGLLVFAAPTVVAGHEIQVGRLLRNHRFERGLATLAPQLHRGSLSDRRLRDDAGKIAQLVDLLTAEALDYVALTNAGLLGWASLGHVRDKRAVVVRQAEVLRDRRRHLLD